MTWMWYVWGSKESRTQENSGGWGIEGPMELNRLWFLSKMAEAGSSNHFESNVPWEFCSNSSLCVPTLLQFGVLDIKLHIKSWQVNVTYLFIDYLGMGRREGNTHNHPIIWKVRQPLVGVLASQSSASASSWAGITAFHLLLKVFPNMGSDFWPITFFI